MRLGDNRKLPNLHGAYAARVAAEVRSVDPRLSKSAKRSSVWGTNGRLKAPQRAIELARDFQHAATVAAEQFGVQPGRARAQYEGEAKDQRDRLQSVVGQRLELALRRGAAADARVAQLLRSRVIGASSRDNSLQPLAIGCSLALVSCQQAISRYKFN